MKLWQLMLMVFAIAACKKDAETPPEQENNPVFGEYLAKTFSRTQGVLPYRILYPIDFSENQKYPLVIFLHGSGERGADNVSQLTHGSLLFKSNLGSFPAIVVFPQCKSNEWWANNQDDQSVQPGYGRFEATDLQPSFPSILLLEALIDSLHGAASIDPDRLYLAGLSMGAMGVNQLLARYPDKFAGAISICGIAPINFGPALSQTPTWIFHGADDPVVLPSHSQEHYDLINNGTDTHRLTIYPNTSHNSWDKAFEESELLPWLFAQSR